METAEIAVFMVLQSSSSATVVIILAGVAPLNKVYKGSRHTVASECNAIFVVYRHESYIEGSALTQ